MRHKTVSLFFYVDWLRIQEAVLFGWISVFPSPPLPRTQIMAWSWSKLITVCHSPPTKTNGTMVWSWINLLKDAYFCLWPYFASWNPVSFKLYFLCGVPQKWLCRFHSEDRMAQHWMRKKGLLFFEIFKISSTHVFGISYWCHSKQCRAQ